MALSTADIDNLLRKVSSTVRGPGGAMAVIKDDALVSRHVWGYADMERLIPLRKETQIPICSISKHMMVLVMMDLARNPTPTMKERQGDLWQQLDEEMRKMLPDLFKDGDERQLKVADLYNMQSGIRDYWAMTVLWGARAEDPFSINSDAVKALERTKSFHFTPGSEFSYSNVNFHVLGQMVERVAGHSLGQLLSQRLFIPAGMSSAELRPNCMGLPLPIVGYEGSEKAGYVPAVNGIEWSGDAGIVASLDDMIAYEKYLHRSWKDRDSLYHAIAVPQIFNDGNPASYSHGLWHTDIGGYNTLSHTGGLRGFRLRRIHAPEAKVSVIAMFNHETDPSGASEIVLKPLLGVSEEEPPAETKVADEWEGYWFDQEQQRVISVEKSINDNDHIMIGYSGRPEKLKVTSANTAKSSAMEARLDNNHLHLVRKGDNAKLDCQRIKNSAASDSIQPPPASDYAGEYTCDEAESTFICHDTTSSKGLMYGSFSGYLGKGPAHLMRYIGEDMWVLICPRSMDAPAPGEWTIIFRRNEAGKVKGATIGCWLARKVVYEKKS